MPTRFDENFDFIKEFRKLDLASPKCGSWSRASENCDYGDITTASRDCYMCFNSGNCQNAYFCEDSRGLKDSCDCALCENCELCYECIVCDSLYNSNYCQDCSNCNDIHFCFDLKRCKDCIGCSGLRNKQYCIFNEQLSKEDYEAKKKKLNLNDESGLLYIRKKLEELKEKTPRMYVHQLDTTNCTGDYIYHSKNCHFCFDTRHTEDSGYIYQANLDMGTRDSYDCGPIPTGMDLCYDISFAHYLFNCKHVYWCGNLKDSQYCINCLESEHLFGCNYLKNKQGAFYILNEKFDEDFYMKKTAEIEKELQEKGIYTIWDLLYKDLSKPSLKVADDILKRECQVCGDGFALCEAEIAFYKKMEIVYPVYCPECRNKQRVSLRNERKMYKRKCDSCDKTLITTYPPQSPYKVVCLPCYWKNIG